MLSSFLVFFAVIYSVHKLHIFLKTDLQVSSVLEMFVKLAEILLKFLSFFLSMIHVLNLIHMHCVDVTYSCRLDLRSEQSEV